MTCARLAWCCAAALAVAGWLFSPPRSVPAEESPKAGAKASNAVPPASSIEEARARARLLHDSLHGALQAIHRDYYREGEKLPLPAVSLERVFDELAANQNVKLRWLAVDARAMNVDHEPADAFERDAVRALDRTPTVFEAREGNVYRYAGAILLHAECLKCHLPARSNNQPRSAALAITIPLRAD